MMSGRSKPSKTILQWNINGVRNKLPKLQALIGEIGAKIIVLQETKVLDNFPIFLKNFHIYRRGRTNHGGGLCTAVHRSLPSQAVTYNTNFEILVTKVMFKDVMLNICNVYFPSNVDINIEELRKLLLEVPYP